MPRIIFIYGDDNDGDILSTSSPGGTSWADARDATTGTATSNGTRNSTAVRATVHGAGRGTYYSVSRAFFEFDVREITQLPQEGETWVEIYGYVNNNADMRLVKSNQSAILTNADFDAIEGWVAGGSNIGNVTLYDVGEITTWNTSGYNIIRLSEQALSDIVRMDTFKCCLIENDQDLRNAAPTVPGGDINYSGVFYVDQTGILVDPRLRILEKDNSVFFGTNF